MNGGIKRKYDILAILSLIFGLLFFIPFSSVLGLIFGIISLVRIHKNTTLKGTWLAIIGIILSLIFLTFTIFVGVKLFPLISELEEAKKGYGKEGIQWTLVLYDISKGKEIEIISDLSEKHAPKIYNDKIVWQDKRNGNYDIYLYDLTKQQEIQITQNEKDQIYPQTFGDKIVWQDKRNGDDDIYMYDLSKGVEVPIFTEGGNQRNPKISDKFITWYEDVSILDPIPKIFAYDLKSKTTEKIDLTKYKLKPSITDIYGDLIVFSDYKSDNIFIFNLSNKKLTQITETNNSHSPKMDGDKIVYFKIVSRSEIKGKTDVFYYNLKTKTEERVTFDGKNVASLIFGNKLVYQKGKDLEDYTLYLYDIRTKKHLEISKNNVDTYSNGFHDNKIVYVYRGM